MRVTNGMIRQTSLNSLYGNMDRMNTLFNQMNTLKKIQRPSDDPIVAGRSMKLKMNVMQAEQHQSNVDEATSWMSVTEASLKNMTEILKEIRTKSNQAANGTLTVEDKAKLQADIKQLTEQLKQEANVTYGGRYVFSGHKTDKPIFLSKDQKIEGDLIKVVKDYLSKNALPVSGDITLGGNMELKKDDMTLGGEVELKGELELKSNTTLGGDTKLGADTTLKGNVTLGGDAKFSTGVKLTQEIEVNGVKYPAGTEIPAGTKIPKGSTLEASTTIQAGDTLPKGTTLNTGTKLQTGTKIPAGTTLVNGTVIPSGSIIKQGNTLTKGEELPDNTVLGAGNMNFEVIGKIDGQDLNYEIGVGTTINVNTLGMDSLAVDIVGDLNEIMQAISGNMSDEEIGKYFSAKIKDIDNRLKQVSDMTADLGSKQQRLDYTKERLKDDTTNFTELLTNTEDVDLEDVYVEFNAQYMVYTSALQATSKVIMNSLADFIK